MNILQDQIEPSDKLIDIENKQISGIEMKVVYSKDPLMAFIFIEKILSNYFEFYSDKVKSDLAKLHPDLENQQDTDQQDLNHLTIFTSYQSDYVSKQENSTKGKKISLEAEETNFREWLDQHGKSDVQSFTWPQIFSLLNEQLSVLDDKQSADKLIKLFIELDSKVNQIKQEQGLKETDVFDLRNIKLKNTIPQNPMQGFKGIDIMKYFVNPSQSQVIDLDTETLPSRIEYCKSIKDKIEKTLRKSIETLPFYHDKSFTFAPVKSISKSATKLDEFHKQIKKDRDTSVDPISALYKLKDLIRCSVVTESPAESAQVVGCIESTPGIRIVEFENGFYTEDPAAFDRTKYAHIKLVLRVGGGHQGMRQEELVEVLIIQNVNIKLKKLENKILNRYEETICNKVIENESLVKQFKIFLTTYNLNAATQVNKSRVSELNFVKNRLIDQFPQNYFEMLDVEQILRSRYSWKNTKFKQMFDRLDVLKNAQGAFVSLKITLSNDKFDVDFEIDKTKLSDLQIDKLDNLRNEILNQGEDFTMKLSNQTGIFIKKQDTERINCLKSSKDSKYIQIAYKKRITKNCAKSGKLIQNFEHHSDQIRSLALSADGLYLYSGSDDRNIVKQNTVTGEKLAIQKLHSGFIGYVECLALNADGLDLYSGSRDSTIVKINTVTEEKIMTQKHHSGCVTCLALSADGLYLYSGSHDKSVIKQSTVTGEKIMTQNYNYNEILSLALSSDGLYLYSGSRHNIIVKQNTVTGEKLMTYEQNSWVSSIALSQDGLDLYSNALDYNSVMKHNTVTGEKLATYQYHNKSVTCLEFNANGQEIYSGSWDCSIVKQKTVIREKITEQKLNDEFTCLKLSPDGLHLQSSSRNTKVLKQNTKSGEIVATYQYHFDQVLSLALSADGLYLYSGSRDKNIVKQNTVTGEKLATYSHHNGWVSSLTLSADGLYLYSASDDKTIVKINTVTGGKIMTQKHLEYLISCLAMSPDGQYLYSGNQGKCVLKHNIVSEEIVYIQEHHRYRVFSLAMSEDGLYLYSASDDGSIVKQNTVNGKVILVFYTKLAVQSIVVFEDQLITAMESGMVSFYHNNSGFEIKSFKINDGPLMRMIQDKNSNIIQIGSLFGRIIKQEM